MVWTGHRQDSGTQCLEELDTVRSKGLKRRGLSRFYSDRSQSFASLELVLTSVHGESTKALGKRSSSCISDDKSSSSTTSSSTSNFASQSLPTSGYQPSSSSDNLSLHSTGGFCGGLSRSEGGISEEEYHTYATGHVASPTWQQQAADDICSALHLRCSLEFNSTSHVGLDGDTAMGAPLTFPVSSKLRRGGGQSLLAVINVSPA